MVWWSWSPSSTWPGPSRAPKRPRSRAAHCLGQRQLHGLPEDAPHPPSEPRRGDTATAWPGHGCAKRVSGERCFSGAFRPLRVISRNENLKVVARALPKRLLQCYSLGWQAVCNFSCADLLQDAYMSWHAWRVIAMLLNPSYGRGRVSLPSKGGRESTC